MTGPKVYIDIRVEGGESRRVVYEPPSNGPWSQALRDLSAAFEVGQLATGMVADILGGLAETAYSSPASRAARHGGRR